MMMTILLTGVIFGQIIFLPLRMALLTLMTFQVPCLRGRKESFHSKKKRRRRKNDDTGEESE